jgi:hypothetical protein
MIPDIGDDINTFQDEYENNHKQIYTKQSAQKNLSLSYEIKKQIQHHLKCLYKRLRR